MILWKTKPCICTFVNLKEGSTSSLSKIVEVKTEDKHMLLIDSKSREYIDEVLTSQIVESKQSPRI